MTRLYLSGPMTGLPDFNRAAFERVGRSLRSLGFEVVDPITEDLRVYGDWERAKLAPWQEHLARDVALVPTCDSIALMSGWQASDGARLELEVALAFKLDLFTVSDDRFSKLTKREPEWARFELSASRASDAGVHHGVYEVESRGVPQQTAFTDVADRLRALRWPVSSVWPRDGEIDFPMTPVLELDSPYDTTGRFITYEENPQRHEFETGGIKDNRGKAPIDLLPSKPLVAIAKILEFGARKYKPHNWRRGLPWPDTYSSLMRHLLAWNDGEDLDPETGESHLAHAGCQLLFLLDYVLTGNGADTDNRFRLVQAETPDSTDARMAAIDADGHDAVHSSSEGA